MKHHWIWILLILFISGCGQGYDWGWYVVSPLHPQGQTNIQFLISGLWYTLLLSVMAILLSIVLGLLIALMTLTKHSLLRKVNRVYVEIFRSIPILVMLLWVYYGLPPALGIRLDVLWAGVRLIVLPQAIKRILPAIGNQFVYMLKMSSLVSVIGMTELTRRADELVVSQYRPLEIYTFLVFEYFVLIIVVSSLVRKLEKKLQTES